MGNANSILATRNGSLGLAIGLPLGIGFIIAQAAAKDVKTWFKKLKKPTWQPPAWIFGPVWSGLYALMGISSWMIWQKCDGFKGKGQAALTLYAAQLLFNFAWTPLFFQSHRLDMALADSVALLGTSAATTVAFSKINPNAAALFAPVVAWTAFATALNAWLLNHNPNAAEIAYDDVDDHSRGHSDLHMRATPANTKAAAQAAIDRARADVREARAEEHKPVVQGAAKKLE